MTLDEHVKHLGRLVGNLQSLEFALRVFLNRQPGARPIGVPHGTDIYESFVGAELPESDLTNYDSLGPLISKFNAAVGPKSGAKIDEGLVELRDALAHGRVSAAVPDEHLRLIKFDKPKNGVVRVAFNEVMTEGWFKLQIGRVYTAIKTVQVHLES